MSTPRHGFLLAAAEWFLHVKRCEPCEHHDPNCEPGHVLFDKMNELGGEET